MLGEDSSFQRVANYLGISDVTSKKKDSFSFHCGMKKQLQVYDRLLPHQRHVNQVSPSVQFKCQFQHCPALQMSNHCIQTLTWGLRKDSLRAIPTQVLAKQNLCHAPGPVIPTATIHIIHLAPLFLQPTSTSQL